MKKLTSAIVEQRADYDGSGRHMQALLAPLRGPRRHRVYTPESGFARPLQKANKTAGVVQFAVAATYEHRSS